MRTPAFWAEPDSLAARLLTPLGTLYAAATRHRVSKGPGWRAPVPVICVGNATAGGSGKTPVVQALARTALVRGVAVHCLSRGYGGTIAGPKRVEPGSDTADEVGDEPLLLAGLAPTWIGRDRAETARLAVADGARLLILDDGLQNPTLAYDLSVLVIDGGFGFGNGRVIPAGPLRETVAAAAGRCGAAVMIGADLRGARAWLPQSLPVIATRIEADATGLRGARVVAFAGLGRPEKFKATLEELGAEVTGWFPFPDHHRFSAHDLATLANASERLDARLVTTEKDFVRLPLPFYGQVTPVPIRLVPDEPDAFAVLLDRVLA